MVRVGQGVASVCLGVGSWIQECGDVELGCRTVVWQASLVQGR